MGQNHAPPLMTATWDTVPDAGAATVVSIFMADMTTRVCRLGRGRQNVR